MYAWEMKFKEFAYLVRDKEISLLKKIFSLEILAKTISMTSTTVASIIIIMVHFAMGGEL